MESTNVKKTKHEPLRGFGGRTFSVGNEQPQRKAVIAEPNKPVRIEPTRIGTSTQGAMPQPAKRNAVSFPMCDAAVRNLADSEWKLADAIVAECSEPGEDGVRNGSQAKMEAMRTEIAKNHGVELSLERIRKLRKVASAFPPGRRRPGLSVEAHLEAGTPDVLDELVKAAPAGAILTRANLRDLKHPTEEADQSTQKEERRHQDEDYLKALQQHCRQLESEKEQLLQRYTESCRSVGKEPEPLSPPLAPEAKPSLTPAEDLERSVRLLLVSRGHDPAALEQAIADFIKVVLAQQQ
jgi:hypothetical protein